MATLKSAYLSFLVLLCINFSLAHTVPPPRLPKLADVKPSRAGLDSGVGVGSGGNGDWAGTGYTQSGAGHGIGSLPGNAIGISRNIGSNSHKKPTKNCTHESGIEHTFFEPAPPRSSIGNTYFEPAPPKSATEYHESGTGNTSTEPAPKSAIEYDP